MIRLLRITKYSFRRQVHSTTLLIFVQERQGIHRKYKIHDHVHTGTRCIWWENETVDRMPGSTHTQPNNENEVYVHGNMMTTTTRRSHDHNLSVVRRELHMSTQTQTPARKQAPNCSSTATKSTEPPDTRKNTFLRGGGVMFDTPFQLSE